MKALILAGGKGKRLFPLSRQNYPKQFVELIKGRSLFQLTLTRLLGYFAPGDIFILSQQDYKFHIINQIEFLNLSSKEKRTLRNNLILEPLSRNTAPCSLLALKYLEEKRKGREEVIFLFPSDHIIEPKEKFIQTLPNAKRLADKGYIVTFGVLPDEAKSGYGYILVEDKCEEGYLVKRFVEKPSLKRAKELIKKGAFWNAGIFCFKKGIFLEELEKYAPAIFNYYKKEYSQIVENFSSFPEVSIDYAVMQKTRRAALVEFNLRWSDLGSWDSFLKFFSSSDGSFSIGKAEFINSRKCYFFSPKRLTIGVGVDNLMVVDTPDCILVMKRGKSEKISDVVKMLEKRGSEVVKESTIVYRPWGYYKVLEVGENYKVKEIGVYPHKYISYQRHKFRSEHWNVVEGKAKITLKEKEFIIKRNQSLFVPRMTKHRVYNPTNRLLRIIETQIGTYLGEDDIERFDTY